MTQLKYSGEKLIPSVLFFSSESEWDIGKNALAGMAIHPLAGVANFKSHLSDPEYRYEVTAVNGDHFCLKPHEATKRFLMKIVKNMEDALLKEFGAMGGTIDRAVITVPAKFPVVAKGRTKKAARDCGLDVKLTSEPTAAATDYLQSYTEFDRPGAVIMVYDFGGGTFDVSIVQRQPNNLKEIATGGDNSLGGNLLTDRVVQYLIKRIEERYAIQFPKDADELDDLDSEEIDEYRSNMAEIWRNANHMKEILSGENESERDLQLIIKGKPKVFGAYLSREDFEDMIRPDINRTVDIVQQTLKKASEKGINRVDVVVMAGGSSNIPLAREALKERFPDLEIDPATNASFLISRGAAILAERIVQLDSIEHITNTQIGTRARDGFVYNKFQMLIPENAPLPASGSQTFLLEKDDQREYKIYYYEYDVDNYPGMTRTDQEGMEQVNVLTVELPPGLRKVDTEIEVTFTMQKDGTLEIKAVTKDRDGKVINDGKLKIKNESDWE